jgi:hypothetical protein
MTEKMMTGKMPNREMLTEKNADWGKCPTELAGGMPNGKMPNGEKCRKEEISNGNANRENMPNEGNVN